MTLSLNFTREVKNAGSRFIRKAIHHLKRRQGQLRLNPAQIVVNEDKDAEALLEQLHSRIDNIAKDKYYSPDLESTLRGMKWTPDPGPWIAKVKV